MATLKVLIVDDEKLSLDLLVSLCRAFDFIGEINAFTDPLKALEFIQNNDIDLALLDIDMPNLDGITLAKKINELKGKTNVIITTAYSQYALEAYHNDCSGYLLKPISQETLKHQLDILRYPVYKNKTLRANCFGNFEVFYQDVPIHFNYHKSKELLAFLIDRNGSLCTNGQIAAELWEDDINHSEYLKRLKRDLLNKFAKINPNFIISKRGLIGVRKDEISCDLYEYLDNNKKELYKGEYMEQYFWAEYRRAQFTFERK